MIACFELLLKARGTIAITSVYNHDTLVHIVKSSPYGSLNKRTSYLERTRPVYIPYSACGLAQKRSLHVQTVEPFASLKLDRTRMSL